jgi:hypothetical protein
MCIPPVDVALKIRQAAFQRVGRNLRAPEILWNFRAAR